MKLIKKAISAAENKVKNKQYEEAELICEQLMKVDPKNISGLYLLGISKQKLKKSNESIECFEKIVNLLPNDAEAHNSLGLLTLCSGDIDKAIELFISAINIDPKNANSWSNLGCQFRVKKQYESSIRCLEEALGLSGACDDKIIVNLAGALAEDLQIKKAVKYLKQAIKINPKNHCAHFDLGCSYFLQNRFKKAWKHFDHRFKSFEHLELLINNFSKNKKWKGQQIKDGKTILFFSEQGIGDTINFIRFIEDFNKKFPNVNVKILVPEEIKGILEKNTKAKFVNEIEDHDYWCPLLNIPYLLKISKKQIKDNFKPYIKSDRVCDYSKFEKMFKIGVCWAGNPAHPRDRDRCCELKYFKELYDLPNVKLFSLQKDLRPRTWPNEKNPVDLADFGDIKLINMAPHMQSWEDTASIIEGLDLIVSVDTSVLHLSGSMGKKTFALIPKFPDWRWSLSGDKTIWYPSVRLFRQQSYNDWRSTFLEIKNEIKSFV
jgi:hypothetical protein